MWTRNYQNHGHEISIMMTMNVASQWNKVLDLKYETGDRWVESTSPPFSISSRKTEAIMQLKEQESNHESIKQDCFWGL